MNKRLYQLGWLRLDLRSAWLHARSGQWHGVRRNLRYAWWDFVAVVKGEITPF